MGLKAWFGRLFGADKQQAERGRDASDVADERAARGGLAADEPRGAAKGDTSGVDPLAPLRGLPLERAAPRAMELIERTPDPIAAASLLGWLATTAREPALPLRLRLEVSDFFSARGSYDEAAAALEPATKGDRSEALPVLARLADLARQRGAIDEAVRLYEELLAVDLAHPGVRERLQRLRAPAQAGGAGATLLSPEAAQLAGGRFELARELGRGGAGAVFLGRDRALGRSVALKLYHPARRGERDERLRGEAQVACAVASRHVVRVYDLLEDLGAITMEFCAGGALRGALRSAGGGLDARLRALRGIAAGLAVVHEAGWVHRDLKPGNVLVRGDGEAVLTDFGLARRVGVHVEPYEGTPGYVPPEVRTQSVADPRVDVYAYGALARELLAEHSSPSLEALVRAATSDDPRQRPRDGAELLEALERAVS